MLPDSRRGLGILSNINELEILQIVRLERKPNWGGSREYTFQMFLADLGIQHTSDVLSEGVLSNILNGRSGANEGRLLNLIVGSGLSQRRAREAIEESLGLPGLFDCRSRADVLALLRRIDDQFAAASPPVFLNASFTGNFGLTKSENEAIAHLAEAVQFADSPIVYWDAPFNSGSSTIVRNIWPILAAAGLYSEMAVLRPRDLEAPFEAELSGIRDYLHNRGYQVSTRSALAGAIRAERLLIVILSPYTVDEETDSNSARILIKEFQSLSVRWKGCCNLLVVGHSAWLRKLLIAGSERLSSWLYRRLSLQGETCFVEFQAQWRRFASLRNQTASEESGSRMRRAATYFRRQNSDKVWPMTVKLRALFASNKRTAAYFDPTQGFRRLAGPDYGQFDDIREYLEDVETYILYTRSGGGTAGSAASKSHKFYYLLQYVSTAKHWLTDDALAVLIAKDESKKARERRLDTEKGRMKEFPIITIKTDTYEGVKKARYFASIGVKAAVQDDWMRSDPFARSIAHHRIAERLKEHENDKGLLKREFPYDPQWGRSRIFFLSEAIRHLVRSCETYKGPDRDPASYNSRLRPTAPEQENAGTDPAHVINYCYEVLYQNDLNNNANGQFGRALSRRYGAYQLAVEILELLSQDYEIGVPHRALKWEHRVAFMRECGFALLDVGDPDRSKGIFERALAECDPADRPIDAAKLSLDLALVACITGSITVARDLVCQARQQIERLHETRKTEKDEAYHPVRVLYRRLLTRDAHLAFLEGDPARTLDLLDQVENEDRWKEFKDGEAYKRATLVPSFSPNSETEQVAHLRIAAQHRSGESIDRSMNICFKEMLTAQSSGLHHQAMGFRIALARCFRRMGKLETSEVILDAVHGDLLKFGCSERTFLGFLNEAGRVLDGLGDPVRAYATYFRPCIGRAGAEGFRREAEQAAQQSIMTLDKIRGLRSTTEESKWTYRLEEALTKHRDLVRRAEHVFRDEPFERDPLFAYAIADAESVITRLRTVDDIDAERRRVRLLLEAMEINSGCI